jgi:flavin-dependent trigonelline monooxygenase, oxygenase component
MLRRAAVYETKEEERLVVRASADYARHFDNLFRNVGGVRGGFAEQTLAADVADPDACRPEMILDSMVFGTPEQVVLKLRQYQAVGVDQFCYGANFGLPHQMERKSLELFITKVMPHFAEQAAEALSSDLLT